MLTTAILAWGLQGSVWGPRQITDNLHRSNPPPSHKQPPIHISSYQPDKQVCAMHHIHNVRSMNIVAVVLVVVVVVVILL